MLKTFTKLEALAVRFVAALLCIVVCASSIDASEAKFAEYKAGVESFVVGKTQTEEVQMKLGSPYWKRIHNGASDGLRYEEWRYPTGPAEMTSLLFQQNYLGARRVIPQPQVTLHDDSPIMNGRGAKLRERLRSVGVGMKSADLEKIRRPTFVIPQDELNQILAAVKQAAPKFGLENVIESDTAPGDSWMYECGDLKITYYLKNDEIVEIVELLMPSPAQIKKMLSTDANKNF